MHQIARIRESEVDFSFLTNFFPSRHLWTCQQNCAALLWTDRLTINPRLVMPWKNKKVYKWRGLQFFVKQKEFLKLYSSGSTSNLTDISHWLEQWYQDFVHIYPWFCIVLSSSLHPLWILLGIKVRHKCDKNYFPHRLFSLFKII